MRARHVMIGCAALAIACLSQSDVSAGRRNRSEQPADRTTILPSREELAAVPVPQQGRALAYPADVVRYGLTVHPGARLARRVMGR